jgi:hypothetical protein
MERASPLFYASFFTFVVYGQVKGSQTRKSVGLMWPTRCICSAHAHLKNLQNFHQFCGCNPNCYFFSLAWSWSTIPRFEWVAAKLLFSRLAHETFFQDSCDPRSTEDKIDLDSFSWLYMLVASPKIHLYVVECFEETQDDYRNLWYVKSSLSQEICSLFGQFVISAQVSKKQHLDWPTDWYTQAVSD